MSDTFRNACVIKTLQSYWDTSASPGTDNSCINTWPNKRKAFHPSEEYCPGIELPFYFLIIQTLQQKLIIKKCSWCFRWAASSLTALVSIVDSFYINDQEWLVFFCKTLIIICRQNAIAEFVSINDFINKITSMHKTC